MPGAAGPDTVAPREGAPLAETTASPPVPERPSKQGFWRHVLATLLGLLLTPFALLLVGIGTAGLGEIAGQEDVTGDLLSLGLLLAGVAVLAAIVLLGVWSPALPITGGLVWGIGLGVAYLVVPNRMATAAESLTSDGSIPKSIGQLADAAMSGYLLVFGVLILAAGLAAAYARRAGRRWTEAVAVADRADADRDRVGDVRTADGSTAPRAEVGRRESRT